VNTAVSILMDPASEVRTIQIILFASFAICVFVFVLSQP